MAFRKDDDGDPINRAVNEMESSDHPHGAATENTPLLLMPSPSLSTTATVASTVTTSLLPPPSSASALFASSWTENGLCLPAAVCAPPPPPPPSSLSTALAAPSSPKQEYSPMVTHLRRSSKALPPLPPLTEQQHLKRTFSEERFISFRNDLPDSSDDWGDGTGNDAIAGSRLLGMKKDNQATADLLSTRAIQRKRSVSLGAANDHYHEDPRPLATLSLPHLKTHCHQYRQRESIGSIGGDSFTSVDPKQQENNSKNDKVLVEKSCQEGTDSTNPTATVQEQQQEGEQQPHFSIAILYGFIHAAIILPILLSFGSIIYSDDIFNDYMPLFMKLTVISGMVHQLCFSLCSSMPFAIGQVQDAGLIFLSRMAANMAHYTHEYTAAPDEENNYLTPQERDQIMLATVTIGLSIATALLGLGCIVLGKLKLAQYIQWLPTSVIGGYLAFIGWFCGLSGIRLMSRAAAQITTTNTQEQAFFPPSAHLIIPGLVAGLLFYLLVRKIRHMATLPICIVSLFIIFYIVLYVTNTSLEEASHAGWLPPRPSNKDDNGNPSKDAWYHTWDYFQFDKVCWQAIWRPEQCLTWLGMWWVVGLSSSLDIAAIELEYRRSLNYNAELIMVGLSNVVSGLTGGYTGSYIFSQTIFSLRAGMQNSRLVGLTLAALECAVATVLPLETMLALVPNFCFASLLIMISIDLLVEWLWEVRWKLTGAEYVVCWATFGLIQWWGVEYGIMGGILFYILGLKLGWNMEQISSSSSSSDAGDRQQAEQQQGQHHSHNKHHEKSGHKEEEYGKTFGDIMI